MIRKTESTYKERNLYITYIGKERKRVQSRTQKDTKKGAKNSPSKNTWQK